MRLDATGHIKFINRLFLNIVGYPGQELVGEHFSKIDLPEAAYPVLKKLLNKCFQHPGQFFTFSHRKLDSRGRAFWTKWDFTCITNRDNNLIEILAFGRDISGEQQAQNANLRALPNSNLQVIWSRWSFSFMIQAVKDMTFKIQNGGIQIPAKKLHKLTHTLQ